MKIHIVEDESIIYNGYVAILKSELKNASVVGYSKNGAEALEWLKNNVADVIITDYKMPVMDGIDFLEKLSSINQEHKVLLVSAFYSHKEITHCIYLGASGYVDKAEVHDCLTDAVLSVHKGGFYFSKNIKNTIIAYETNHNRFKDNHDLEEVLSDKQKVILKLLMEGYSEQDVAEKLGNAWSTIRTHTETMRNKLNVETTIGVIAKAKEYGFR